MRVLVTGGLGFIGSNLSDRLLQEGHAVVLFDNGSRPGVLRNLQWLQECYGKQLQFIRGDTRRFDAVQEAMQDVDVVYHLAAQVAVTSSVLNPLEDFGMNALGSLHVLEAARQKKPAPIVVFTSTNKVYGGMEHVRILEKQTRYEMPDYPEGIRENFPLDFHSPYGCSKGAADQYVRDYHRIYGLPTVVFRMSCIYGPRQFGNEDQGWVAHFVLTALHNHPLTIYGDGKQVRDLLYIDDLVEALLLGVHHIDRTAGRVYNIGGGPANAVSIWKEFSEHLARSVNRLPPVTYGDWRPGDQRVYISDIRQARQDLGWQPKISVAEGLARLTAWAEKAMRTLERSL